MNSKSFYTMLSYGYASKVVSRALRGEATLKGDIMIKNIIQSKNSVKLGVFQLLHFLPELIY